MTSGCNCLTDELDRRHRGSASRQLSQNKSSGWRGKFVDGFAIHARHLALGCKATPSAGRSIKPSQPAVCIW
jgi:hypothetical protein